MRLLGNFFSIFLFATSILVPGEVSAQDQAEIASLEVSLWPEFDRPQVLVIYRLELAAGTPLPATVKVPIPAQVGEPFAVAVRGPGEGLLVAPYTRQLEGDWASIIVEADSAQVQIEYYADLEIVGDQRRFDFRWPEGFAAGAVRYEIQKPFGAEDLQITPPFDNQAVGNDGLLYYTADLGPLDRPSSFNISFSYIKEEATLTIEQLEPSAPQLSRPESTQGRTPDLSQIFPWVLGGFGILLLASGAFFYLRMYRPPTGGPGRPDKRMKSPAARGAEGISDVRRVFCHNCGVEAGVGDRFCRHCGTRLRQ